MLNGTDRGVGVCKADELVLLISIGAHMTLEFIDMWGSSIFNMKGYSWVYDTFSRRNRGTKERGTPGAGIVHLLVVFKDGFLPVWGMRVGR
jgi:hypothetical protein